MISCIVAGGWVVALMRFVAALIVTMRNGSIYGSYGFTELLVNFRGGFVRRGLLGELLYQLASNCGLNVSLTILLLCLSAAALVIGFFACQFVKKGYCWWLLLSPLFCGFVMCIVRKDFLLYALFITSIYLLRSHRTFAVILLTVLGLFLHEAYVFWGVPIVIMLLWANNWRGGIGTAVLFAGVFALLSVNKGSVDTALAINHSWDSLQLFPPLPSLTGSIASLGWDTSYAVKFHLSKNFVYNGSLLLPMLLRPLFYLLAYYLLTNFIFVFSSNPPSERDHTNLSSLYLLVSLTMLPMFICLSCDYARLYQYIAVSAFAPFLILSPSALSEALPHRLQQAAIRLNTLLNRLLPPSRGVLIVLLLFLAEMPCYFDLYGALQISLAGRWVSLLSYF